MRLDEENQDDSGRSGVSINRRRGERRQVQVGVTLTSESNLYLGFTDNVSEGGLFVATHELVEIGSRVDLEFELPGADEPIQVRGEVRWQRPISDAQDGIFPGFGVKFLDLDENDRETIQEFIASREPMFHPE